MLVASGFSLEAVLELTLDQVKEYTQAVERRRKKARTEQLMVLRAAKYPKTEYLEILKASRTAEWLIPA